MPPPRSPDRDLLKARDKCLLDVAKALGMPSEYALPPGVVSAISVFGLEADQIGTQRAVHEHPTVRPPKPADARRVSASWDDEVTPVWPVKPRP